MRLIKMLGLAAMATMVATAFIGAATASANETDLLLCKKLELVCLDPTAPETVIHGHAVEPKLLSTLGTVLCNESLALLTLLNELAKLQIGHLTELSFTGKCHLGETSCTVTVNELGLISFTKSGPLKAAAESTGGTSATVKCGFFVNCTYSGKPVLEAVSLPKEEGSELDGGLLHLIAEKTVLSEGKGFLCPEKSEWDANYLAVSLEELKPVHNLYIES